MSNWFAGIGQAASGIDAARYGLSVVSQNIANADTTGYSRQVSQQVSVDGTVSTGIHSRRVNTQQTLGGVKVASTDRMDDPVVDARARTEHARTSSTATTASQLTDVESVFGEPSDDALSGQLSDFWSSWATLANNPGSSATRSVVLQDASGVASTLRASSSGLSDLTSSTATNLGADLDSANAAASQLATLNGNIAVGTATGANVNSLLDQRDQLLDKLSTLVGGVATIAPNGAASVSVGGQSLVSGTSATTITADSSYQVSVGGTAVTLSQGSAAARVSALTTTLPGYQARLDAVANALSSAVNGLQSGGYDLNGNAGAALFSGTGASDIAVAITDPSQLAASATAGGNLDGSNALAASKQGASSTGPDALYTSLIGDIGADSAQAQQQSTTQSAVSANVDSLKSSVSGVSYDEEVTNMLTFQRAFQASSRVLTTLDDMLDTLINHTGRVGQA